MRLAIVDDESVYRNHIAELINVVYGAENVSCYLYSDGSEIVKSFEEGFGFDAVFLDIEMKELDGMSTAKVIRKYSKDIPIIFLTSHTEMAMDGYEVDAFRFLSKPVKKDKLLETLNELEKKLKVEEKIIVKYRIWNQENRSFVKLDAFREASLRPVDQLSGHIGWRFRPMYYGSWSFSPQGYRNVKSDRTEYFFDSYPEEDTVITEELFVTQSGTFTAPVVTIESLYAPHYRANDAFHGVLRSK